MTDDLKQLLDKALPNSPPAPRIQLDELEVKGASALKRRRWGITGGSTVAAVAALALTLAVPGLFGGGDGLSAATGSQPEFPLPELIPDQQYMWDLESEKDTDSSKQYTEAFLSWFDDQEIPVRWLYSADDGSEETPPNVINAAEALYATAGPGGSNEWERTGYTRPIYELVTPYGDSGQPQQNDESGITYESGTYTRYASPRFGDSEFADRMSLSVYPKGSFLTGSGETVGHLVNCADHPITTETGGGEPRFKAEVDCTEQTGPNGEQILSAQTKIIEIETDRYLKLERQVVVYHPDGTAVSIVDWPDGGSEAENGVELPDGLEPGLTLEQLTDLALIMLPADFS